MSEKGGKKFPSSLLTWIICEMVLATNSGRRRKPRVHVICRESLAQPLYSSWDLDLGIMVHSFVGISWMVAFFFGSRLLLLFASSFFLLLGFRVFRQWVLRGKGVVY